MSTKSLIAKRNDNGLISCIYCHFDGYLAGVGKTLIDCYDTDNKVAELIKLGDISSLDSTPEMTESYYRNYNEDYNNVKPKLFKGEDKLINYYLNSDCDYLYLFDPDTRTWLYYNYKQSKFFPVADEFINEN